MTQREVSNMLHASSSSRKRKGFKRHKRSHSNIKEEKQIKKLNSQSTSSLLPGLSTFEENTKVWLNSRHSRVQVQVRHNEFLSEQTRPSQDLTVPEPPPTRNKTKTSRFRSSETEKEKVKRKSAEDLKVKEMSKTKKQKKNLDNLNLATSFVENERKKNSRKNQREKLKLLSLQSDLKHTTENTNGIDRGDVSFPKNEQKSLFSSTSLLSSSFIQSSSSVAAFNSSIESCEILSRNSSLFLETTPYLSFLAQKAQNNQKLLTLAKETGESKEEINQQETQKGLRFNPHSLYFDTKKSVKDWCLRLVSELYSLRIQEGETKEKADFLLVSAENRKPEIDCIQIKTEPSSFDAKTQVPTSIRSLDTSPCACHSDFCASSHSHFFSTQSSSSSSSSFSSSSSSLCLSTGSPSSVRNQINCQKEQEKEKARHKEQRSLVTNSGKGQNKQKLEKEANHKKEKYRHVLTPENFHFATLLRLLKRSTAYKTRQNVLALKDTRVTHIGCRRREHENGSWAKNASFYIGFSDDTELFVTYTECLDNDIEGYLNGCYLTYGNQEPLHTTAECKEELLLHHTNATQAWNYPTAFNHAVRCHFNKRKTNYFQELKKKEKNNNFFDLEKVRGESIVKYQSFHTFESILQGFIEKFEYSPSYLESKIKIKGKSKCTIDDPLISEQWQQYHDAIPLVLCVPIETWSEKLANKIILYSWQLDVVNEENDVALALRNQPQHMPLKTENVSSHFISKSNNNNDSEYSSYKILRLPQNFQKVKEKRKVNSVRSSSRLKKKAKNDGKKGNDMSRSSPLQQETPRSKLKKSKEHSLFVKDHLPNTTKSSFLFSFFGFSIIILPFFWKRFSFKFECGFLIQKKRIIRIDCTCKANTFTNKVKILLVFHLSFNFPS